MRYFLFTYSYHQISGHYGVGTITEIGELFPSETRLKQDIRDHLKDQSAKICVTNVYEFKDSEDYHNFQK